MGIALAVALVVNGFRIFTPNEVFPVAYGGGKKAHLDVGGARGEAIRSAVQDQLGLCVIDMKPVGLAGSGGSTPLRLRVAGDPDTYLFGKLYAMSHVRADRWYKLGRTVIYGRLEDEAPVPVGAAARPVRGLHAPPLPRRRDPHGRCHSGSSSSRPSASTCSSRSSSTARRRSARPTSTTTSSTRHSGWSARSGTLVLPTATSSRRTSSCATGTC